MVSAINSALSGLAASSQKLNVSANNIANAESTQTRRDGAVENTPYVPQRVAQISQAEGGVIAQVLPVNPPERQVYDPNNAAANAEGITRYPNVDMAEQLVQTQLSLYTAQANINVIRVQSSMLKSVVNIIS